MTDLRDLNKGTPAKPTGVPSGEHEKELAHRRMEQEAMKGAKRASEREKRDEGNDEFSNVGPV